MLIAENETTIKALQGHLDEIWKLIDSGEPKDKVVGWLRKGNHRSISDWAATEVADLIDQDKRNASIQAGPRDA
jgi:hypothetical protein